MNCTRFSCLTELIFSQGGHFLFFLEDDIIQAEIQGVGQTSQVEQLIAHFIFNDGSAMGAQTAGNMGIHIFRQVFQRYIFRDYLLFGMDFDTAAAGYSLDYRPVDLGGSVLIFGYNIQNAAVSNQLLLYLVLIALKYHILHITMHTPITC